jgi:hypothetical protein
VTRRERREDHDLRKSIDDYSRRAAEARAQAKDAPTDAIRNQLLGLAKSWEELAKELSAAYRMDKK